MTDERPASPSLSNGNLVLTLGDPAGIGPEVVLKALAHCALPIAVVGSRALLWQCYEQLRQRPTYREGSLAHPDELTILDVPVDATLESIQGRGSAVSGAASFASLDEAIARTIRGEFAGIVTAPIAKSAWKEAGHHYPGQTEVLAHRAGVDKFGMLFVARSPHTGWTLRTLLATTHIPLRQVPQALTPELMSLKLELLVHCLKTDFGLEAPRIVVSGLNPHSGEQGQLGLEERDWLIPWLAQAQRQYPRIELSGPVPPDTLWVKPGQAWYGGSARAADGYLALYHDQGLIPVKLMAFDRAVNTTIGLPFVRTSPDHGTAFDIAGKGIADATSMLEAIQLAMELVKQRMSAYL
ncbi:MAG: 4-hydroxythreonine-4-phosphate dehydrogenase PdxA [Cyanophyceae cyanobacterium]